MAGMAAPEKRPEDEASRYVLITQCLQNDFLLNPECRLVLPERSVRTMLLGRHQFELKTGEVVRQLPAKAVAAGPLGLFLEQTIGRRRRGEDGLGVLDVINIRDWHVPDDNYDHERRRYGAHCEKGTWGAGYVDGLERWLDPAGPLPAEEARSFEEGSVRIHHVHADSIFDFRPRRAHRRRGASSASALEVLLDVIVQGRDDQERARDPALDRALPLARRSDADRAPVSTSQ